MPLSKDDFSPDYWDRFSGLARLYGLAGLHRLSRARIAVVGVGGVGSWTAESLARSGVGHLALVDLDEICITNTNRQVHALDGEVGRFKASALVERLRRIHPGGEFVEALAFFTENTAERLLAPGYDCVVDAIDRIPDKACLIAACVERGIPVVVAGGAGGKRRPAEIAVGDLAATSNDGLLRLVRRELRKRYGFPEADSGKLFGVRAVYSREVASFPWSDGTVRSEAEPGAALRLNCDTGFGTSSAVTGTFGLAAAAEAIEAVLGVGLEGTGGKFG